MIELRPPCLQGPSRAPANVTRGTHLISMPDLPPKPYQLSLPAQRKKKAMAMQASSSDAGGANDNDGSSFVRGTSPEQASQCALVYVIRLFDGSMLYLLITCNYTAHNSCGPQAHMLSRSLTKALRLPNFCILPCHAFACMPACRSRTPVSASLAAWTRWTTFQAWSSTKSRTTSVYGATKSF